MHMCISKAKVKHTMGHFLLRGGGWTASVSRGSGLRLCLMGEGGLALFQGGEWSVSLSDGGGWTASRFQGGERSASLSEGEGFSDHVTASLTCPTFWSRDCQSDLSDLAVV